MIIPRKAKSLVLTLPTLAALAIFSQTSQAEEPPCPFFENRLGLCGY